MCVLESSVLKGQKFAVWFNTVLLKQELKLAVEAEVIKPWPRYQFLHRRRNKFITAHPHLFLWTGTISEIS